jgi:hypothetical protein
MPDINWGGDSSTAPFSSRLDEANGDLILAEDNSGGTALLEYDGSTWQYRGPVEMNGEDISGVGTLTATGATISGTVNAGAVETDKGVVGPIETVQNSEDAQSIIENASAGSHIYLDPSGAWNIIPPFEPPTDVTLWGSGNIFTGKQNPDEVAPTLKKAGDGDLMAVPNGFSATGVVFDGDRSNYTGDGLVDSAWNHSGINLHNVKIQHVAGDARVHDSTAFCYYRQLQIQSCDGAGIKNITTNYDSLRRSRFEEVRVSDCACGIHHTDTGERDNYYQVRLTNLNGPAIKCEMDAGESVKDVEIRGSIFTNDGPAVYVNGGFLDNVTLKTRMSGNAESVSVSTTSPIADGIHIESSGQASVVHLQNASIRSPGTDAGTRIHSHVSGVFDQLKLTATASTLTGSPRSIGGNVNLTADETSFQQLDFSGNAGIGLSTRNDNPRVVDLSDGARVYQGVYTSEPHGAGGYEGSVYIDDGTNTSDGNPSWRYDNGSNWVDI